MVFISREQSEKLYQYYLNKGDIENADLQRKSIENILTEKSVRYRYVAQKFINNSNDSENLGWFSYIVNLIYKYLRKYLGDISVNI
uniref:Uncharacterized protein n=1 Tax=Marseillevirus LCMAC201 TaxID=2506605 RepID=A0A481YXG8_9VIRU|nr:MAG: hypothetical protein LCMAC201_00880 [Marseillevirus LCMAC201]